MFGPEMTLINSYNEILVDTPSYKMTFSLLVSTRFLGFLVSIDVIANGTYLY